MGHINQGNPRVRCVLQYLTEQQICFDLTELEFQIGHKKQTVSITLPITSLSLRLASKPFTLIPGRYCGEFCLYVPAPLRTAAEIKAYAARA
jgi:hypothetical protein